MRTETRAAPVALGVRRTRPGGVTLAGHAAVWGALSSDLGGFRERVAPSAFLRCELDGFRGVIARANHHDKLLLATADAGTLKVWSDARGLAFEIHPPRHRADIVELVERGDITHCSFMFKVAERGESWSTLDDGTPLRTLVDASLLDIAPVVQSAYSASSVAIAADPLSGRHRVLDLLGRRWNVAA